jgi:hypothetical protein
VKKNGNRKGIKENKRSGDVKKFNDLWKKARKEFNSCH